MLNGPPARDTSPFAASYAQLADKSLAIIPIQPGEKRPHSALGRDWTRYAKAPATYDQLEQWATALTGAGVGLLTGRASGVIALDVDTDDKAQLAAIEQVLPRSPVKKRGARGFTAFFRFNGECNRKIGCIDLLSDGKQCVLPPSTHPAAGHYHYTTPETLEGIDLAELPTMTADDWAQLTAVMVQLGYVASDTGSGQPLGEAVPEYDISEGEFRKLRDALIYIPADDRDQWIRAGMCLRTIGQEGFELWREWSARSEKYDAAAQRDLPRLWAGFKTVEGGLTYESIYKMARAHGWTDPPLPDYAAQLAAGQKAKHPTKGGLRILFPPDLGQLVPPAWIIKKHVIADSLAMLYGPSGVGKSFVALDMGLCVATGRQWQGYDVKPGLVLYVAGEGMAGITKRIEAWCKVHGVGSSTVPIGVTSQSVPFLDDQRVNELLTVIDGLPSMPALIIVDTLARNFGNGSENDTGDMSAFVDGMARIQSLTRACVMVVHHTGKGDTELARGNSSLRAAMDTEMLLKGGDAGIKLVCTKQKDAAAFNPTGFELEIITLGHDEDGEEITSCVVKPSAATQGATLIEQLKAGRRVGKNQRHALDVVRAAVATIQRNDPTRDLFTIERTKLYDDLESEIPVKQRRYDTIAWLVDSRVLDDQNRFTYIVNLDVLHAAILAA
jgi:hypothetical protein